MLPKLQLQCPNLENGCAEAIVRGHKGSLLTTADYNNLTQCETLDDIKLHLVRYEKI